MASNKQTVFTTGVREESFDCLWKIENFLTVQEDETLVQEQKLQFDTKGSSVQSLWQVGLNVYYPQRLKTIGVYFKLVSLDGAPHVSSRIKLHLQKNDGETQWESTEKKTVKTGDDINFETVFQFNRSERNGLPWLDENGMITLGITITTFSVVEAKNACGTSHKEIENFKNKSVANLQNNLAAFLSDSNSCDVKLICNDDVELRAHSAFLKAQCPVFESMLCAESNFSESVSGIIQIDDISSNIMSLLLHYIYTGELKQGWNDPANIVEFTYAAGKYQLTPILEMLDNVIGREEDETCTLVLLSLANKLSLEKAESKLMERIVKMTSKAKNTSELFRIFEADF